MSIFNITWKELSNKWENGDQVYSGSMGGMGYGYEMAIQKLIFEILKESPEDIKFNITEGQSEYPQEYQDIVEAAADKLDPSLGFSGAQVGAAKGLAFQFIHYGYKHMMEEIPEEIIFVKEESDATSKFAKN